MLSRKTRLGEGCRTEANAADELSCSPSTASELAVAASPSSAYLLAARPLAFVGVLGEASAAFLDCGIPIRTGSAKILPDRGTYLCLGQLGILDFEIGFGLPESSLGVCGLLGCFLDQLSHGIMHIVVIGLAFRLLPG